MSDLTLLPQPRQLTLTGGALFISPNRLIVLDASDAGALFFSAKRLQAALAERVGVGWEIVANATAPHAQVGATLSVVASGTRHPQGYELTITPEGIHAVASTPAGLFYAVCTLIQLLEVGRPEGGKLETASNLQPPTFSLPTLRISDWPDFPSRGVMLDVSRNRVPTLPTLLELVDLLASWKVNQLQLYTEHTFAYRNHPEVWADASPLTGEEILALDAYCRERFIELVPNQNSFGHMTRWLTHDRYRPLAEAPHGCDTRWGRRDEPISLCPIDPGSIELVRSMFDELLPHFSSRQFNVGCDETIDLGQVRSKAAVAELGAGRVYLNFLLQIYREVKAHGRTMQFWGDIIMEHPELVPELPRDLIALEWGYEAAHPFEQHGAIFAASGVPFYVCPGTGTWNTIAGRTESSLGNLRNAAENGLKHGAVGYLITDWGDAGHWQPLPVSYLGFGYGAAVSWACAANVESDIAAAVSAFAFHDLTGTLGRIAYDLGNAYLKTGVAIHNSTIMARLMQITFAQFVVNRARYPNLTADGLQAAIAKIDAVMARWPASDTDGEPVEPTPAQQQGKAAAWQKAGGAVGERVEPTPLPYSRPAIAQHPGRELIRREYAWAADMLRHGARRGIWMLGKLDGAEDVALRAALVADAERLMAEYRDLWHARSRPGGFAESVARMEKMRGDYLA